MFGGVRQDLGWLIIESVLQKQRDSQGNGNNLVSREVECLPPNVLVQWDLFHVQVILDMVYCSWGD